MHNDELTPEQERKLAQLYLDPALFSSVILGRDLWSQQRRIINSVFTNKNTAVKSCHSSGKTFCAAVSTLWWLVRYAPDALVITTAPTWHQVENLLWGEIREAVMWANKNKTFAFPQCHRTELRFGEKHYAIGLSTNEGVRFQGFHAKHVLMIMDEAPGVNERIIEGMEGIRAGGHVHQLKLGNPVIPAGHFYNCFHDAKEAALWHQITINAFHTPNFRDYRTLDKLLATNGEFDVSKFPQPHLTTPVWVYEIFHKKGLNSPFFQSRVLGEFPEQSDMAVYPAKWINRAQRTCPYTKNYKPDWNKMIDLGLTLHAGVDVAGPGNDETVVYIRCGGHIVDFKVWSIPDPRHEVLSFLAPYKDAFTRVTVDANGIGYHFATFLMDKGFPVYAANFAFRANEETRFVNQRAEMYWLFREWLEADAVTGLTDPDTQSQLNSILYTEEGDRVFIETKKDAKKRGMNSPDRAEALILAFSDVVEGGETEELVQHDVSEEFQGISRW